MAGELYYDAYEAITRLADDLTAEYWSVPAGDGTVSINKYKIAGSYGGQAGADQDKRIDALFSAAQLKGKAPRTGAFGRAKLGKAAPGDFAHMFDMALKSGHRKEEDLQAWADQNLGVDCTGFTAAYLDSIGMLPLSKYSGGVGCPWILAQAKMAAARKKVASPLIWSFDEVGPDDLILWMFDNGVETRSPGHISVVCTAKPAGQVLLCAESSGEPDGKGHSGPRLKERPWNGVKSAGGKRYVDLNGAQVIIVRLYDKIG